MPPGLPENSTWNGTFIETIHLDVDAAPVSLNLFIKFIFVYVAVISGLNHVRG